MSVISSILILAAIVSSSLAILLLVVWIYKGGGVNILFPGLGLIVATPPLIVLFLILSIIFVIAAAVIQPRFQTSNEKTERNHHRRIDESGKQI